MNTSKQDRSYFILAFKIVGDFGVSIAVPVVLFVWVAGKIETTYGGDPWVTITGFILAAALTTMRVVRQAKAYGKEFRSIEKMSEIKKDGTDVS